MKCSFLAALVFFMAPVALRSAEPTISSNDLPRVPATEPRDALKTFKVEKGFHLELAASEPNIASPVAMAFDENGRLFVVEMIDYSERREETPHLGRIRMLEDKNGDGVYEKSTVFADNLPWPTAVFCWNGGILVGATPDILFLKDSNADGKADVREVVFTGFAEGVKRINVQAMLNSFVWGLDNRIHGATSGNGGMIKSLRHPGNRQVDLHGRDFVIEPRNMTMTSEAGGGQHGLSFDDSGRRFACNNSDHLRLFMYDDRYANRNPFYTMPPPLVSIAADGPAAEVYRISPEEPWRVIRTRWRVAGLVGGPVEGGGRASGYFTGATGATIYRGDAFPPAFLDNAFIGDAGGNLVHRKILQPDGPGLIARRPPGEEKVEFIASTDTWFRPVQFANGPDGAFYIIDMYREVIEHPWSLPENIKRFIDLNSGNDRGRIYRIVPDKFKRRPVPRLGKASTRELVSTLEHPNAWHGETAARLLYERQDKTAVKYLNNLLKNSSSSRARLHSLYALEGLGALEPESLMRALGDSDADVRQHALKLSEPFIHAGQAVLAEKIARLTNDPAITVRFQLAFTLGELPPNQRLAPLAAIAAQDYEDPWMRAAILSSLSEGAGDLFTRLSGISKLAESKAGQELLRQLVALVGGKHDEEEINTVFAFIQAQNQPGLSFDMVRALGEGLQRGHTSLAELKSQQIGQIMVAAAKLTQDTAAAEKDRVAAAQLLGQTSSPDAMKALLGLLDLSQPQELQLAALSSLSRYNDPELAPAIIEHWPNLTPRVRAEAVTLLLARPDRAEAMLKAVQQGVIQPSSLTTTQVRFLRNHDNAAVKELATQVLESKAASTRQQTIETFMPSLSLKGQAEHGRKIYQERCISCHRSGKDGFPLGPDLVTVKNSGREKLLVNILDPNREVRPEFVAYEIETKSQESVIGIIVSETATTVTVRQAYGKEDTIKRADIKKIRSQGQSLMPEGLEAGMTPRDMADLLTFIESTENSPPK